jgi:hypothetical protein
MRGELLEAPAQGCGDGLARIAVAQLRAREDVPDLGHIGDASARPGPEGGESDRRGAGGDDEDVGDVEGCFHGLAPFLDRRDSAEVTPGLGVTSQVDQERHVRCREGTELEPIGDQWLAQPSAIGHAVILASERPMVGAAVGAGTPVRALPTPCRVCPTH